MAATKGGAFFGEIHQHQPQIRGGCFLSLRYALRILDVPLMSAMMCRKPFRFPKRLHKIT